MVKMIKYTTNYRMPRTVRKMVYECDVCGARCNPEGTMSEKLYKLEDVEEQLCFECLKDIVTWDWIIDTLEYNDWLTEITE